MKGTQTKPAFCSQIWLSTPFSTAICGAPTTGAKAPRAMTTGIRNCITLTPRLPKPALMARALPFSVLGKKKRDVRHRGGEVAAAQAAEQGQNHEDDVGRVRVLHRHADADRGDQQGQGREHRPQPPAEDRHHEAVEDPQRGARQGRQRRQPEQLLGGEVEADQLQLGDDHRPDHPDREGQQQVRDRNPQVAAWRSSCRWRPRTRDPPGASRSADVGVGTEAIGLSLRVSRRPRRAGRRKQDRWKGWGAGRPFPAVQAGRAARASARRSIRRMAKCIQVRADGDQHEQQHEAAGPDAGQIVQQRRRRSAE